jgi:hypothetical protein
MNQRIQLLAEQARKKPMGNSWCYTNPAEFEQKFAELIVQDCADLFEVQYGQSEVSGNEVARVLKQHFGVEE